jgi:Spy/CpxP family protein refolding chaperone
MFGCIALALVGGALIARKIRRHHRCHGGWHGHHGYYQDYGEPSHWRGGPWRMMAHLGTTPAQEKVIREEAGRLRDRGRAAKEEAAGARADLAEVLRGDTFDRARFDAALGKVEGAWAGFKGAAAESVARVHETLDTRQREKLADFLSRDRKGPHFGPFR